MGINYTYLDKPELALKNILRGQNLAREINSPENIILAYGALSDYYEKMSLFQLALENYKNEVHLRDSITSAETRQNIDALEASYENELKDNEIQKYRYQSHIQEDRNLLQWIIILFLLLLVSALIVFYRLKRKHNKLVIVQMRNDIQEYVQQIEKYEHKPDQEEEKITFYKNVEQYGLSEREVDVLLLISKGLKNEEIANALFVSLSTVKTHTRNIFVKLDVRNRIEAARKTQII
jgi:ATP/maltotriose-dependent transcriptional regulator MalT